MYHMHVYVHSYMVCINKYLCIMDNGHRVMCVCTVALGKSFRTENNMQGVTGPPSGCDSISGEVGAVLNYPECVVYNDDAVCPKYLIVYAPPQ